MTTIHIPPALFGAAMLAVAGGANAATNLIVNGDFASPNTSGGTSQTASIPGWFSNTGDSIEVGTSTNYGLPCINGGCQHLEVNSNRFGSVSQTVAGLNVGSAYNLTYLYGGRSGYGPQLLDVSFGGNLLTVNGGSLGMWTSNTFSFLATSTSETLTFASEHTTGGPSGGNEVTNVSLTTVPEPASWTLMILGIGMVGVAVRRRGGAVHAA